MNTVQALLSFTAAASILTLTPGVDTAMVLRAAAVDGSRQARLAALGIGLGCLAWGAAVSVGLGALLAASEQAFTALKWAGAAYLVWLGLRLIFRPRTGFSAPDGTVPQQTGIDALRRGFLTNILNPKVGVFYLTFLPQFVPDGQSIAVFSFLLAFIHVVLTVAWFGVIIAAMIPMSRVLSRPAVIKSLDRLTGTVFIAFGLRLVLARPN